MLTTERLDILPASAEDIPELYAIEHDPANSPYIFKKTVEEHLKELENPDILNFMVKLKEDGSTVGYVIIDLETKAEWFEIRRLAFTRKNCGYGRELLTELIRYAFEDLNMNKVWLEAYPDNLPAMHLYKSLGFFVEGVRRQHSREERGLLDEVQLSMLRNEYLELKEKIFLYKTRE